ncbi:MJ0042-type zinc finger domain-containing protein [Bradyrhizobium sp.]|uniref:MJ0042-type zinc finger domain-containing protein n=1 Tax=Bradyrhizobium sp. TaxID=376 RepID=UPI003C542703
MHIVCPHCTTSYAIDMATLGAAGRNVRCSRCKEIWLARPEDAVEIAPVAAAMATTAQPGGQDDTDGWGLPAEEEAPYPPTVESPSIAADWQGDGSSSEAESDWAALAQNDAPDSEDVPRRAGWFSKRSKRAGRSLTGGGSFVNLRTGCAAMGALVLALIVWRVDVVRLMPQTASFYKMAGLGVNLRGLSFRDVKVTSETVEGKPVLVIEGVIVGETRNVVDLPRLRFSVRDAQGAEIYAWNTVLEQTVLEPGERAVFKSRLASPPTEGRSIDIRFFNRRDIAGGNV